MNIQIERRDESATDQSSEFTSGVCAWCGDEGAIYRDNGLCEYCDTDIVRCAICKEDQHTFFPCRHVFRDDDFEWAGAGVMDAPSDAAKKSLLLLLDAMPRAFADDLRAAIKSGRFHTWVVAPIIGGGGHLTLYGMSVTASFRWGDALIALGEREDSDHFHDGYRWLVSLYDSDTPEANAATLALIDEWKTSK